MQSFVVDGHDYSWGKASGTIIVWDSSEALIGTAQQDIEKFYWILEDAEGVFLARLIIDENTDSEVAHTIAELAE